MVWRPVVLRVAVTVPSPEAFVLTEAVGMKFTAGSLLVNVREKIPVTLFEKASVAWAVTVNNVPAGGV